MSVNIQPNHAAILEGEKEIFLTDQHTLSESFNGIPLFIRPQGFFQTNPLVAQGLYATAQDWVQDLSITKLWDLFCGVGGFGLHCAKALQDKHQQEVELTGIEISPSAIQAATQSAQVLGLNNVKFQSLDAANFALTQDENKPDLVIVNRLVEVSEGNSLSFSMKCNRTLFFIPAVTRFPWEKICSI